MTGMRKAVENKVRVIDSTLFRFGNTHPWGVSSAELENADTSIYRPGFRWLRTEATLLKGARASPRGRQVSAPPPTQAINLLSEHFR